MQPILKYMEPCEEGTCMIEDLTEKVQELTKQRDDAMEYVSGIVGQIRVLTSEVKALSEMLSFQQRQEWAMRHKAYCRQLGVDPVTGVSIRELGESDLEREV